MSENKGLVLIIDDAFFYHRIPREILEREHGYETESYHYCDLEEALETNKKYCGAMLWLGPAIHACIERTNQTVKRLKKYDSLLPIAAFTSTPEKSEETIDYRNSLGGEKILIIAYGEPKLRAKEAIRRVDEFFISKRK